MKSVVCGLACLLICTAIAGCNQGRADVAPVTGVVTYQGQPVEGAQVTFMAPGAARAAFGVTDAQGRFRLSTFGTNDGAVAGVHTVTIAKPERSPDAGTMSPDDPDSGYAEAMRQAATPQPKPRGELPAKYADPKTSGLTREVVLGESNEFSFDLED